MATTRKNKPEGMLPIVFQMPESLIEEMRGTRDTKDTEHQKGIEGTRKSVEEVGKSLLRHRLETQSEFLKHRTQSKSDMDRMKKETDSVIKELEDAFGVVWQKHKEHGDTHAAHDKTHEELEANLKTAFEKASKKLNDLETLSERKHQSVLKKVRSVEEKIEAQNLTEIREEVKRLEKVLKKAATYEYGSSLNVLNNATPVGFTGILNFKDGTNTTAKVSLNKAGGIDVEIDASGGGVTPLIPSAGVVDGSNKVFTFASAPKIIVLDNGNMMNKVSSDGTVNWTGTTTVTLTQAPDFNIFGL